MVYDRPNYMGNQYFMRRGEYSDYSRMSMFETIRSCRMIPMVSSVLSAQQTAHVFKMYKIRLN